MTRARFALQLTAVFLAAFAAICASRAWACDVPVFRYALERWASAPYELVVLHRGPLSAGQRDAVEWLGEAAQKGRGPNLRVRLFDLAESSDPSPKQMWQEAGRPELPCMVLHYPRVLEIKRAIWSGRATASNARLVVDSPARREIASRILAGDSAVWVLLESGDSEKDDAAKALLERSLKDAEQTLELPPGLGSAPLGRDDPAQRASPPLHIRFSLLSLSRADPAESLFISMLLHSEPDLDQYSSQPLAFPIYGRGRALYALVGRGITEENVRQACVTLVGACSCVVKADNPGTDLLMAADWDAGLAGSVVAAVESQPLVGLGTLSEAARMAKAAAPMRGAAARTPDAAAPKREAPAPTPESSASAPTASAPSPDASTRTRETSDGAPQASTRASQVSAEAPQAAAAAPRVSASLEGDADAPSPGLPGGLVRNMLIAVGLIVAVAALLVIVTARRGQARR